MPGTCGADGAAARSDTDPWLNGDLNSHTAMKELLTPSVLVRVGPFVLFMVLLAVRGAWPEGGPIDPRWLYGVSTVVVGYSLIHLRRHYRELHGWAAPGGASVWRSAGLAVFAGVVLFALWIELSHPWMMLGQPTASFKPVDANGELIWSLVTFRWVGATLVVPVMEELFWRAYLMRWIDNPDFEQVAPEQISLKAMVLSSVAFTLVHNQWVAAFIAGMLFAWLYRHTRSLWVAVLCHAVTNGVLGVWVVMTGHWHFW